MHIRSVCYLFSLNVELFLFFLFVFCVTMACIMIAIICSCDDFGLELWEIYLSCSLCKQLVNVAVCVYSMSV